MRRASAARAAAGALALALSVACGGERVEPAAPDTAASAPPPEPGAPLSPSAEPKPDKSPDDVASEIVNSALRVVASVRQLPPKGPVTGKMLDRQSMVDHVKKKIETDVPPDVVKGHRELLVLLGIVPIDFDYTRSILDLMGAQLAGFYEPDNKTMYLAKDLVGLERRATLSHELVHALQDQHYDLGNQIDYRPDGGDRQAAVHSLAEGDAMSAMLDDMLVPAGKSALDISDSLLAVQVRSSIAMDAKSAHVPGILKSSIVAPYVDGTIFVHALRRRGGWAKVDEAWRDPPKTTEQLLHLDKFEAREPSVTVPIPSPHPGGPKKVLYRDVMGEQTLLLTLDEWTPRRPAEEGAAGWGGDRVAVFRDDATYALAWHLVFDTEADAREAYDLFVTAVAASTSSKARRPGSRRFCGERRDRGPLGVARRKKDVALVAGPYVSAGQSSRSAGDCAAALRWAQAVAAQR